MENQLTDIDKESTELSVKAQGTVVENQVNYDMAGNFLKSCMNLEKKISLFFEPTIAKFKSSKAEAEKGRKAEVERMNAHLAPVQEAIDIVRGKCKEFENEQERLRKIEQDKKDKEAKDEANREKKRLKDQADVEKEWGDNEKAEELKKDADNIEVEQKKAEPTIAKSSGLGIRRTWKWKVTNDKEIPREFLKIDEVYINKYVRENQDKANIAGIETYYA